MKGKLALEVDRGDCRGRVGDWVGLGVKGERTRKIESQSFGPEPFENFGTGFYFRSARLGWRSFPTGYFGLTHSISCFWVGSSSVRGCWYMESSQDELRV